MKIKMGKQYGTRGNPTVAVRIDKILESQCVYRVRGAVRNSKGAFWYMSWTIGGRIYDKLTINSNDLVPLVPLVVDEPKVTPREIYVNIDEYGKLCATYYREDGPSHRMARFVEVVEDVEPKPLSGTVIRWMNVYEDDSISIHHKTRRKADQVAYTNRLACVKITVPWTEGQFDDK